MPATPKDPAEILAELGAQWSPDFDAYASGTLPAHLVRCLMCESAPCECQARGLVFGSAAYFARLDAMHGRTPSATARTCSAPECPLTATVGEHPAGLAISASGPRDALGRPGLPTSTACMIDVRPPSAPAAADED
jgi:hypothetical protein